MDHNQKIIQSAHEKNKQFLKELIRRKLASPKTTLDDIADLDIEALLADDADLKEYKEVRDKYKKQKMRTNFDLMEAFNETALKFIPLYQKRVN